MKYITARQAWHDAFMDDVKGVDIGEILSGIGVQFSSVGADNKIMDHCEKGFIQDAIAKLGDRDRLAYSWGMCAYTPDGHPSGKERATVISYLLNYGRKSFSDRNEQKLGLMAHAAITSYKLRDQGAFQRVSSRNIRELIGCKDDIKRWNKEWKPVWRKFSALLDPLPARALSPVSEIVYSQKIIRELEQFVVCD